MKLPWLCICGGAIGDFIARSLSRSHQNSSFVTGTQIGGGFLPHSGSSAFSGSGSITAPDRICAPIVDAFSITQTRISGLSCLSRIANARPAGPAPTVTTSYSMMSRSVMAGSGAVGEPRDFRGLVAQAPSSCGKQAVTARGEGWKCRIATLFPLTDPPFTAHYSSCAISLRRYSLRYEYEPPGCTEITASINRSRASK